ncbi:MAG: hypothetical protein ACRDGH_04550 [Candidatus Limnocylindria bacterium]
MPIDWTRAAERSKELEDQGYSPAQINNVLNREMGLTPEQEENQRRMAAASQALHSDSMPPGDMPEKPLGVDIMESAFKAQGGARVRPASGMSDRAMEAGFERLFERARANDDEATFKRADESWSAARARYDAQQARRGR